MTAQGHPKTTLKQKVDWMLSHQELWAGYPHTGIRHLQMALIGAGLYSDTMEIGKVKPDMLVASAREERIRRLERELK